MSPTYLAGTTIASGIMPHRTFDINHFHCCYDHKRETFLYETAIQSAVTLAGELQSCTGCCVGEALRKAIPSTATTRAKKKFQRVFVNISEEKDVATVGGSHYCMSARDDYNCFACIYFLDTKLEEQTLRGISWECSRPRGRRNSAKQRR